MTNGNPRRAALAILIRIERERSYGEVLIDRELQRGVILGPDRGLLTELVYGVQRRLGTLDAIINQFSSQPVDRLERPVRALLRLGLYQLFYLDRVPASAAVNETVKLAKEFAPRAAGFVNAVLRRADRERDGLLFPDRNQDPGGFLAAFYSHPHWLVEQWLSQLGRGEAEELARVMAEPAPRTLRINTLKIGRDELCRQLAVDGVELVPTRFSPHGLHYGSSLVAARHPAFAEGLYTIQDESSQLASLLLAPLPGERLLDLCAAPGGKTTHLAQLMDNRGEIVACDASPQRLALLAETCRRLGTTIIRTVLLTGTDCCPAPAAASFDRILVDAPCSGLGVIRRNPEGKWWKSATDASMLATRQRKILNAAAPGLSPGGVLLYSVCTTTPEETDGVIDDFLSQHHDFVLEDLRELFPAVAELCTDRGCFRSWPHRHGMDGFYAARLRKSLA